MSKRKPTRRPKRRRETEQQRENRATRAMLAREVKGRRQILSLTSQLARLIDRNDRALRELAGEIAERFGDRLVPARETLVGRADDRHSNSDVGADVVGGGAH